MVAVCARVLMIVLRTAIFTAPIFRAASPQTIATSRRLGLLTAASYHSSPCETGAGQPIKLGGFDRTWAQGIDKIGGQQIAGFLTGDDAQADRPAHSMSSRTPTT